MIVVDSSVWIDNLRDDPTPAVCKLRALRSFSTILVGDLILMEVLQGARDEKHARILENALRQYPVVTMLGDRNAIAAASHYRILRSMGITVRKSADLIIAAFCIAGGHALLHSDRDFYPFEKHFGLQTV